MLLSIIDSFFTIASWWMLPLLLISWLLGSWFWNLTTGKRLKSNIEDLETNVSNLESEIKGHLAKINELEIPTGNPLVIEFGNSLEINKYYYLDKARTKTIIFNQ